MDKTQTKPKPALRRPTRMAQRRQCHTEVETRTPPYRHMVFICQYCKAGV